MMTFIPLNLSAIEEAEVLALVQRIRAVLPYEAAAAFAAIREMIADGDITDGAELLDALEAVLGASGE